MAYSWRLFKRAWKETIYFWTSYRWWVSLSGSVVGILRLVARRGWRQIMNAQDLVVNGIGGVIVAFVGTFVISLFRSVKLLDDDRVSEISGKDSALQAQIAENERLQKLSAEPQVSAVEQERRNEVSAQLKDATTDHIAVWKYILRKGHVDPTGIFSTNGHGVADENAIRHVVSFGIKSDLLKPASGTQNYISVNPHLMNALEFCLYNRPVTPPHPSTSG